jgi:mRNA-degrading endonuclease RelE of RelBE toxin-antitoxin system
MRFTVTMKRSVLKAIGKLPEDVQERFRALSRVLEAEGPAGPHAWKNYSKLCDNEYHCHLNYSYIACWRYEKKTIIIEVYYVGSREDAPY